ncbi:hypothetical protein QBC38DRAFT_264412 [Podospora fimiseda]|uniref:Uncharacterized protein n=1 Tax=Podospora fimiseda TaxID=252190 RepID=A0AAN7H112_9PEZI|nr:hypothetical protein QBC38DRAFT_264412 [Podospora fimiseda]
MMVCIGKQLTKKARVTRLISMYQQNAQLPPTPPDTPITPIRSLCKAGTYATIPRTPTGQARLTRNLSTRACDGTSPATPTSPNKPEALSLILPKSQALRTKTSIASLRATTSQPLAATTASKPLATGPPKTPTIQISPIQIPVPPVLSSPKPTAPLNSPISLAIPKVPKSSLNREVPLESPSPSTTSFSSKTARSSPNSHEIVPDPPTIPIPVTPFRIPSFKSRFRSRKKSLSSESPTTAASPSSLLPDKGLFISNSSPLSSPSYPSPSSFRNPEFDFTFSPSPPSQVEPPPWDRSVEVTWKRRIATRPDKVLYDDELSFQENVTRLKKERIAPDPIRASIRKSNRSSDTTVTNNSNNNTNGDRYLRMGSISTGSSSQQCHRKKKQCLYFLLPDSVRFKIIKYVLSKHFSIDPDQQKAIRLNSVNYLEPIWPVHTSGQKFWTTEYFDSLQSVLAPLCGYMNTCYDMRVDFLSALFLTRRFHVVFSPFVTERTQPAATLFLDTYGPLMKWITLEVDYSKLGGHWHRSALWMDQGNCLTRVAELVDRFAERQATRYEGVNIQSFALLVRRYYGFRVGVTRRRVVERVVERKEEEDVKGKGKAVDAPSSPVEPTVVRQEIEELIPYTDDKHLDILYPLKKLGMHVDSFIIVGATKNFANDLMYAFWGNEETPRGPGWKNAINRHRNYRVPVAYPYTPGQSSMINRGPKQGGVQIAWHVRDPRQWIGMNGCTLKKDVNVVEVNRKDPTGSNGFTPSYGVVFKPGGGPRCNGVRSGQGGPEVVVKVNKFVPKVSGPVVMKPPEQPRRFGSVILGRRSFSCGPFGHHHGMGRTSSNKARPSPLSGSSLVNSSTEKGRDLDDVRASSAAEKGSGGDVDTEAAMSSLLEEKDEDAQPDGDGVSCKKRGFWGPSKIPVQIRKHTWSLTRSRSKGVDKDDGEKARFGKLVKKASKDVLGKRFFSGSSSNGK